MIRSSGAVEATIATGYVNSYDEKTHTARVRFEDIDDLVSYPYQVCVQRSKGNRQETHLDVDEHVLCLCLGNGLETGFVVGTLYDDTNPPLVGNKDRFVMEFKDGASFFYDRSQHVAQFADSFGSFILFQDGGIVIQSVNNIELNPGRQPLPLGDHLSSQFD